MYYEIPPGTTIADLKERVAALEELVAHPLQIVSAPPGNFSDAQVAELRQHLGDAMSGPFTHRVIQQPPPLTRDEVRQLLRECVTVVKPGETLVIRDRNWTPEQIREIQRWMDDEHGSGRISFKVLAVIGEEMGVAQPESDERFAARVMNAVSKMADMRATRYPA